MISDFLNDPITMEIMAGPNSPNISGTLDGASSLFAFIGFDQGDDPISPILALLEETRLDFTKFNTTGRSSWAQGIERGLSGLGYLLRKNKGRSGAAIQSSVKVRGGRFKNRPYISAFLRKYKKRFEDLK